MRSATGFLAQYLGLTSVQATHFIVAYFNEYVLNYLQDHPRALDPDLAQIKARVHLTMDNPPVQWLWNQESPESQKQWGQEEHATAFVLHVFDFVVDEGLFPENSSIDEAVYQIHRRLCVLQSLWLRNGVWIEDQELQAQLAGDLETIMQVELARATCPAEY